MAKGSKRKVSVAIVGGGFGGVGAAIRLLEAGITDLTIFERNEGIGGVWQANSYPGAACDVPSHLYSFSFAPGTEWSRRYAPQADIEKYLNTLVDDFGVRPHVRCKTAVESAHFDVETKSWRVQSSDGQTRNFDILISACGQLSNPSIPKLNGMDQFEGPSFHSATWDHSFDFSGKRVAVVGTGASAIQFVPEIAKQAAQVDIYQRSAPWILHKFDREYANWERRLFNRFPMRVALSRRFFFSVFEILTYGFTSRHWLLKPMQTLSNAYRKKELGDDPELLAKATPDYQIGCKRALFSNDWYPTLKRPNIELVHGSSPSVTKQGLIDAEGVERPADVIVWGTGFEPLDFVAPMEIYGLEGTELSEAWNGRPEAYLGTTVSGFPNMFIMYGPNTNHGSGSVPYSNECQYNYILDAIKHLEDGSYGYLDLKSDVLAKWRSEMEKRSAETVWTKGGCSSWYVTEQGVNTNNWPGPWLEYKRRTKKVVPGEYDFV
ncbi:MAG: NAD(P)/FAD-dependent oxidoreductase [Rhodobiaceae bacterium]|nr:NAD(P)/FAD-dependent oxidoreductase [Rhodobiaceae bacterium]